MNTYENKDEYIDLEKYIPAKNFRTIPPELRSVPHGKSEIKVVIELSKESTFFKTVLPQYFIGMMYVHGYVKDNDYLREIFTDDLAKGYSNRHIALYDWKDKFRIEFENGSKTFEKSFFVTVESVWNLLRMCLHPSER